MPEIVSDPRSNAPLITVHRSLAGSEKLAEFPDGETSIAYDPTHRVGVHGIVAWNRQDADSVGHHDMFCLGARAESRLSEGRARHPGG